MSRAARPPSPVRRRVGGGLVAALVAVLLTLLAAPAASAHDVLVGSDPADGSSVPVAPAQVTLTFAEEPQKQFATMTVVGPDGSHHESGPATADGDRVSVGVRPGGPAGRYEVGYRVLSDDGHPVSGSVAFTVTAPAGGPAPSVGGASAGVASAAPGAPAPPAGSVPATPSASPVASSSGADPSSGTAGWVVAAVAVVVVGAALGVVLRRRT